MVVAFVRTARAARSLPCTNSSGVHRSEVHVIRLDGFVHQQEREHRHGPSPARTLLECNEVKCTSLPGWSCTSSGHTTGRRATNSASIVTWVPIQWDLGQSRVPVFELISGKIHHEATRRCSNLLCSWCHRLGVAFPMHYHHSCRPTQN